MVMVKSDPFSSYYEKHLDGVYDCVDRIVLNGYFYLGQTGGGFRYWWRKLMGDDANLDNTHLMRFSGRFSRRVRAYCQKEGIFLRYCDPDDDKHKLAESLIPEDDTFCGVFCILVSRAPNVVMEVHKYESGAINIRRKEPKPHVNHYSFHIIDPEWGHITIKLCPHPPFNVQIILNGHEYAAVKAKKKNIEFIKEGNCFTSVSNVPGLNTIAETMSAQGAEGRLFQVCERWVYSACLCFALNLDEQARSGFHYDYSVYQVEYSRNLFFESGYKMDQIYESVIDRTRALLDIKTLKTIFGYQHRPHRRSKSKNQPKLEVAVERPVYNMTIFRIQYGKLVVKIYSKGERVLRVEAVVHNTNALKCGKRLDKFSQIVVVLKSILERFLCVLHSVDASFIHHKTLDDWRLPSRVGASRVGGIDIQQKRIQAVMQAILALSAFPGQRGFTAPELAEKIREILPLNSINYQTRQASYDLKKFRGKQLIDKIEKSRRYEAKPMAIRNIAACQILQQKVMKPLLENGGKARLKPKPPNQSQIDEHYRNIQVEMQHIFKHFNIAA
jgi:hypothetical protein